MASPVQYQPAYYSFEPIEWEKSSVSLRVASAALPFLALHKPFGKAMTVASQSLRCASHLNSLWNNLKWNTSTLTKVGDIAISVAVLASTFFSYRIGTGMATLVELLGDLPRATKNPEAFFNCLHQAAYLGVLTIGSVEIIALSLFLSMAVEAFKAKGEWQKGRMIETTAHALMSIVRFSQGLPILAEKQERLLPLAQKVENIRNATSFHFYNWARRCVTPLWFSTNLWLKTVSLCNDSEVSKEQKLKSTVISYVASLALLPGTLVGLAAGQVLHFTAFLIAPKPFTHLIGTGAEEIKKTLSAFQLNCCLTAGGFASLFGGLARSDADRLSEIIEIIREENPDLLALQEVSDPVSAYTLYEALKDRFHDFYLNIGMTPWILQNNSGLFVASKASITSPAFKSFQDIPGTESMVNKGYFSFMLGICKLINTHLSPSNDDDNPSPAEIEARREEQQRILNEKPDLVFGDFNTKKGPLFNQAIASVSGDSCQTDYLKRANFKKEKDAEPNQGHFFDHVLRFCSDLLAGYSRSDICRTDDPAEALSDHPAICSKVILHQDTHTHSVGLSEGPPVAETQDFAFG